MQAEVKIETKSGWKGTITLTVPLNHIRTVELQKARTAKLIESKKMKGMSEEEREEAALKNVQILSDTYSFARNYIHAVDLTGPEGEKCESRDALETHPDLSEIWQDIAVKYAVGFGPGKTKSP